MGVVNDVAGSVACRDLSVRGSLVESGRGRDQRFGLQTGRVDRAARDQRHDEARGVDDGNQGSCHAKHSVCGFVALGVFEETRNGPIVAEDQTGDNRSSSPSRCLKDV